MPLTYDLTQFSMIVNPDQTVELRKYSTLGLSDQDQTLWPDLFTNLTQTLWLRLNCLAKSFTTLSTSNLKITWPCLKGMDQVNIIAWGFYFNSFMPSFSFFLFIFFSFTFLFSFLFFFLFFSFFFFLFSQLFAE